MKQKKNVQETAIPVVKTVKSDDIAKGPTEKVVVPKDKVQQVKDLKQIKPVAFDLPIPPKQILYNVDLTPLEHVLPFIKDCMVITNQEDKKSFVIAENALKEHLQIGSLISHAKAHNYIPKIYSALQLNGWNVPQSWVPFIHLIRAALVVARLFTPPHIDIMIDRIIYIIDAFLQKNSKP